MLHSTNGCTHKCKEEVKISIMASCLKFLLYLFIVFIS